MKSRRTIATIGAVCLTAGLLGTVLSQGAGAQGVTASADIVGITENRWLVSYDGGFECLNDDPVVTEASVDGTPVEIVSQAPASGGSVSLLLPPAGPAGNAGFTIECATVAPNAAPASDDYAIIAVEKVVDGPAPEGTTFTVNVSCTGRLDPEAAATGGFDDVGPSQNDDPISPDLTYGATGGVAYVYSDFARECDIAETNDVGAASSTVDPEFLFVDAPETFDVTVTNVFPIVPIVVEPTFTG